MAKSSINPFASWGIEELKYSIEAAEETNIVELKEKGFTSKLTDDHLFTVIDEDRKSFLSDVGNFTVPASETFFGSNESINPSVLTHAYALESDLQPEREAGENLNYYGAQDVVEPVTNEGQTEDLQPEEPTNDGGNQDQTPDDQGEEPINNSPELDPSDPLIDPVVPNNTDGE